MNSKKLFSISLLAVVFLAIGTFVYQKETNERWFGKKSGTSQINAAFGEFQNGDIIFQASLSNQSKAIQLATHSEWSHCGIIYKEGTRYFVYEAVQPVKLTPLEKWLARGEKQRYVVKRLKNAQAVLTPDVLQKMKQEEEKFTGKDYDIYFEWTDEKIYCSELIWKIYKEATGLELGALEQLKDFDLTNKIVQSKMKERYGEKIPMEEKVISPAGIFNSALLMTVKEN